MDTLTPLLKLGRFAILATLGFSSALLLLDVMAGVGQPPRFLTVGVTITVFQVVAVEFVTAVIAVLVIVLRKP